MYNYNQDYFILVDDFSKEDINLEYSMGTYGSLRSSQLHDGPLNKPLKFIIDKENWMKGRKPDSAILLGNGLIIKDDLKPYFITLGQHDIVMHNVFFEDPDETLHEGFWFIPTPIKPKEWLDTEKSELDRRDEEGEDNSIFNINKYVFDNYILNAINEKQRQYFKMPFDEYGLTQQVLHKTIAQDLIKLKNRNFKFIPLSLFESSMGFQGPLPEFAI